MGRKNKNKTEEDPQDEGGAVEASQPEPKVEETKVEEKNGAAEPPKEEGKYFTY